MPEQSAQSPHISDDFSDLQALAVRALRVYGDQSAESADGSTILMFVDFANEILEEVRQHPYWDGTPLNYYKSQTSRTTVPDAVVWRGLLAKYAIQQASDRANRFDADYKRTMNTVLWNRKNGNKPIKLEPMDGGSNLGNGKTDMGLSADQLRALANNGQ